jgi:hypothetical protein
MRRPTLIDGLSLAVVSGLVMAATLAVINDYSGGLIVASGAASFVGWFLARLHLAPSATILASSTLGWTAGLLSDPGRTFAVLLTALAPLTGERRDRG